MFCHRNCFKCPHKLRAAPQFCKLALLICNVISPIIVKCASKEVCSLGILDYIPNYHGVKPCSNHTVNPCLN